MQKRTTRCSKRVRGKFKKTTRWSICSLRELSHGQDTTS
jgi:hypothetical protein